MTLTSERGAVRTAILIALGGLAVIVGGWGAWLIFAPGPIDFAGGRHSPLSGTDVPSPTGAPTELKNANLIARGEYLARAADCIACHTVEGGQAFAGGRSLVLPFGTLYTTNITPDKKTGIGDYTDADWLRVIRKGVSRDGTRLYPAMPYASYTYMTDEDALAIKAYLFSLPAVQSTPPITALSFPYNQRWAVSVWSAMFNADKRFEPNTERSAEWNRGAYLAEALAHCGECHTPRTVAFSLDNRHKFAGEKQAGWIAYNISNDKETGIGDWKPREIAQYIASGHAAGRGTADGPMGEAVDYSFRYLTRSDVFAIAAYVATVPAMKGKNQPSLKKEPAPQEHNAGVVATVDLRGKEVYEGVCASCHGWSGLSPSLEYADLISTRAINDPTATNLVQIVLAGSSREGVHGSVYMPDFGRGYSDIEIAAVANYVTARFGSAPSKLTAANVAKLRKETS
jgi:mono/diheme cytochrome c family protein